MSAVHVFALLTLTTVGLCDKLIAKPTPAPVSVSKCCRIGESIKANNGSFFCDPGASQFWVPWIYAPRRKGYLNTGVFPSHWTILENQQPECGPRSEIALVKSSTAQPNFILFANGSLWLQETQTMIPPTYYCVDSPSAALVCTPKDDPPSRLIESTEVSLPIRRIKVKKCCGENAVYDEKTHTCAVSKDGLRLEAEDVKLMSDDEDGNGTIKVQFVQGFPICSSDEVGMVIAGTLKEAALVVDGSLQVSSAGVRLAKEHFCLEFVKGHSYASVFACSESVPQSVQNSGIDKSDLRLTLYPVGLLVSTIFLLATLAAAILLRSTHHALHWRCQMHYIGCLLVGDLMLAITQLAGNGITGTPCIMIAVMIHFFFLAAFFWLNTMCFNIWWTFRDFRPTSLEKRQEVCRLRFYGVFAWGGPLLIAGIALLLDRLPPDPHQTFLRPRFGVQRCWFYGDLEILTFFFGPIGVLLGVNLLLFASTARQLTCGLWKREDVKSTTERAALGRVCMKLVVVMGVTWIADVVSWAVGGPSYLWYMTDLINALQGVLIFIVVGCQPQVWATVKKMWCLKMLRSNTANTTGAIMHSSSQGLPSMGDSVTNNTIANTNTNTNTTVKIPMETVC